MIKDSEYWYKVTPHSKFAWFWQVGVGLMSADNGFTFTKEQAVGKSLKKLKALKKQNEFYDQQVVEGTLTDG